MSSRDFGSSGFFKFILVTNATSILAHLRKEGWAEDIRKMDHTGRLDLRSHKAVRKPQKLTDSGNVILVPAVSNCSWRFSLGIHSWRNRCPDGGDTRSTPAT